MGHLRGGNEDFADLTAEGEVDEEETAGAREEAGAGTGWDGGTAVEACECINVAGVGGVG